MFRLLAVFAHQDHELPLEAVREMKPPTLPICTAGIFMI